MMHMSPGKLILFRLFNISFGRMQWAEQLLRKVLVIVLIGKKSKKDKYMASSGFFVMSELEDGR